MATVQTISAEQKSGFRGWLLIKENKVLVKSIWFSDVTAIDRGAGGLTELLMRNGKEYVTSATVSEVQEAMAKATILFETSSTRWKDRGMNDA
jgi:hypothetical protein